MKNAVLIFDFDGTIADTHHYLIDISNRLSKEFHFKEIRPDEIEGLKDKSSQEIIRILNVPILKIPAIITKAKIEFHKGISSLKTFNGLKETMFDLKEKGFQMGVLSSNSSKNVKKFLKDHQLDVFDFIHTTSKVWTKNTSLKKLIKHYKLEFDKILYVGDEIRDIVAAKRLGIKIAAVTWGYNSKSALKQHNPNYLIHSPHELIELCLKDD